MYSLGHVNHVSFVDYLQESRVDMLRVHAPATGGEQLAEGTVVVRHEVEFVAPLVFRPEPVRIESWVTRIRAASFTMAYEILDEQPDGVRRVYARARTVLTPYIFGEERPRRIRDEERAVLERFLEADEPLGVGR
jgi:acyl-CoA thioester hydrolase